MSEQVQSTRKKKVLIQTDSTLAKTGFGRAARSYIEYLYKLNKYEIIHVAVGMTNASQQELDRFPWKTYAAINLQQLDALKKSNDPKNHEGIERLAGYGAFSTDDAVLKEKPDVFIGCQDIWGVDFSVDKKWFPKITSALWVTLDSLPILQKAIELAPKIKNYWSWADFATKALHNLGHKHVKTIRGPLETKLFHRLPNEQRKNLRINNGLSDEFVIGFVFRNQLRKSVPNLLEGFKIFQKDNPTSKAKLLLHTCWSEGWDIPKLIQENGLNNNDILTTYVCRNCRNYKIMPFNGQELDCPHCKSKKQLVTTHPTIGVNEIQLNEIYNLMDVYAHPFTSGGQEIPIQEAKLTELISLVTNYSCGEDSCQPEAASLPLEWAEYREPGTQFIKATTYPSSIAKQLNKVYNMSEAQRREFGKKGRQWVLDNFAVEIIGKQLEKFIDDAPFANDSAFDNKEESKDPTYNIPIIEDNGKWILEMYHHILKMSNIDENDDGYKYWMTQLSNGMPRKNIEDFFRKTAWEHNQKNNTNQIPFDSLLNKEDKGRILFVQPESAGDILLVTSLFESIKKRYPDWALYVATKPEYKDIILGNPFVTKWIEYNPMMDNHLWAVGNSNHKGFFNICYHPYFGTQRLLDYLNNGEDKIDLNIKK